MHDIGVRTLQVLEREYLSCLYIYSKERISPQNFSTNLGDRFSVE